MNISSNESNDNFFWDQFQNPNNKSVFVIAGSILPVSLAISSIIKLIKKACILAFTRRDQDNNAIENNSIELQSQLQIESGNIASHDNLINLNTVLNVETNNSNNLEESTSNTAENLISNSLNDQQATHHPQQETEINVENNHNSLNQDNFQSYKNSNDKIKHDQENNNSNPNSSFLPLTSISFLNERSNELSI